MVKSSTEKTSQIEQTEEWPEVASNNLEHEELISLFNLSVDMLCTADQNGHFRSINNAFTTTLGYAKEELQNKPLTEFVHPEDLDSTIIEADKLFHGQSVLYFENRYRCKDGSYKWLSWTSSLNPEKDIIFSVARDITEKKQADEELKKHRDHLKELVTEKTKNLQKVNEELQTEFSGHKQAEEELEKSEARYRRLTDNAKDMIYRMSLPDGIYEYVSPSSIDILGYSPEEFYESPNLIQKIIHPDWQGSFNEQWEKLVAGNMPPIYEYQIIHKSGQTKWIHQRNTLVCDDNEQAIAIEGIVTDITERKHTEMALRESEEKYRSIIDNANLGIIVIQDGNRVFFNSRLYEILGYTYEEYLSIDLLSTIHPRDRSRIIDHIGKMLPGTGIDSDSIEVRVLTKTGEVKWIETNSAEIQWEGNPAIQTFALDITKRKQAEEELAKHRKNLEQLVKERTHELEEAQAEIVTQEKYAAIGKMSATVSHELRNPLGTILASCHLIAKLTKEKNPGIEQAINRAKRNIARCDNIIEELMEFTRIRDFHPIPTSIDEWLEQKIDEQGIPDNIKVILNLSSDIDIMLDRESFHRCLTNIIDNALQAMQGEMRNLGEKDKDVYEKCLTVGSRVEKDKLIINITDTGPGIPHDEMEKIFEPLFSTKGFGVGLGLPIAKQIMDLHRGNIEAYSKLEEGTEITLYFPTNEVLP